MGDFKISGGEAHANKCVKVTWTDSSGAEISSQTLETDGSGSASGQVPANAVRWEAKLVDCPEPEPDEGNDDQMFGRSQGGELLAQMPQQPRNAQQLGLRDFLIYGAPITPSDDSGESNLTYTFLVRASTWEHAENLIAPIVAGGVGTPVPESVQVLTFTTMEANAAGARLVSATPGTYTDFSFTFNSGAFSADLASNYNTMQSAVGGWDVIEMMIPLSAFDYGVIPGVTYVNDGSATFSTDRLAGPVNTGYSFSFSN